MSQKVLFLEDGSVTARRLKRAIGSTGRVCVAISDAEGLREELQAGLAVVVHVPSDPRKFQPVLNRVCAQSPCVPVLHVIEESLFVASDWLKSPYHEWVSITATVETVLRRIDNLAHFAALAAQVRESEHRAACIDRFTRGIRGVEIVPVLRQAMSLLRDEMGAENVIWFPDDLIHREIDRYFQIKRKEALPARQAGPVPWLPLEEMNQTQLEDLFDRWNMMAAATGGLDAEPLELKCAGQEMKDVVIPLRPSARRMGAVGRPYGHLIFQRPTKFKNLRGTILLSAYCDLLAQQLEEAMAYSRLQAMTYKDDLTDLYNQRYLPVVLEQELNRASRMAKEFSVLFCDVDFFKLVNDTKGHMVGSRVLVELSKLLKSSIRSTDFAFRYGGDEYVIVLSGANSRNAAQVAERLRQKAAGTTFEINGAEVKITVSIGVATYPEHAKSADEIMQMADEAMYYGKHKSRNVVYVAS